MNLNFINKQVNFKGLRGNDRYFVLGLFFLNLFNFISNLQDVYGFPSILKYVLILSVLFVIIIQLKLSGIPYKSNKILGIVFFIFVIRSIFLLGLSFSMSSFFFQNLFVNQLYFLPYFLPIIILFTQFNILFFKYLFHFSFILSIVGLVSKLLLIAVGVKEELAFLQLNIVGLTSLASGILLMVSHLYKDKYIFKFAFFNLLLNIVIVSILGRRGGLIGGVYILTFFFIIRIQSASVRNIAKGLYSALIVFLLIIFFLVYPYLEKNVYVFQRGITTEGWDESRGDVIDAFFEDFSSTSDWVWGRGLNGTVQRSAKFEADRVTGVENGYLTVILKGGLLYLIPMILLVIKSFYLGFFKTKNDLTKALAATVFIQLLSMFSFGIPEVSSEYIMVWICVAACYSVKLRSLTNNEVIRILN